MGGRLIPQMEKMLKNKRGVCIDALEPAVIYGKFDISSIEGDSVYFKSGHTFNGPNISKILEGSEIAVIFIFTLGKKIDDLINKERGSGGYPGNYHYGCHYHKHAWNSWRSCWQNYKREHTFAKRLWSYLYLFPWPV